MILRSWRTAVHHEATSDKFVAVASLLIVGALLCPPASITLRDVAHPSWPCRYSGIGMNHMDG